MAKLYSAVADSGMPNSIAAHVPVPSGLNVDQWYTIATGHPYDRVVLDGVTYGFDLQYEGSPIPTDMKITNHKSATAFPAQVREYIATELDAGAILGPFDPPQFTWTHASPIMTRPKTSTDPSKRRIIVDLSFTPDANVNMAIAPNVIYGQAYPNKLPTVDDLANML